MSIVEETWSSVNIFLLLTALSCLTGPTYTPPIFSCGYRRVDEQELFSVTKQQVLCFHCV